jgi:uncharacterized protein
MQPLRHRITIALILGFVALQAGAQTAPGGEALRKQAESAPKRGFFWEARKGAQKVYLLGTVHVGRAEFYPPNVEYIRRFNEAAGIVLEADVFDAKHVDEVVRRLALYPDGQPGLDSRISADLKKRVLAQVNRFGLDPERIWRMKPWMLANTLVILESARVGYSPAYATEAFLHQYADNMGKPLLEIESIEIQLSLFERTAQETQISYLDQALRGIESGDAEREVRKIVDAWEHRDSAEAEQLIAAIHQAKTPGERFVAEQLFDARHPRMIEAIEKFAASGSVYLVAVGALHYFGPGGLLQALRNRGYSITPIP